MLAGCQRPSPLPPRRPARRPADRDATAPRPPPGQALRGPPDPSGRRSGHGKSTALAEAVANNQLEPVGIDVLAGPLPLRHRTAPAPGRPGPEPGPRTHPRPGCGHRGHRRPGLGPRPRPGGPDRRRCPPPGPTRPPVRSSAALLEQLPTNGHLVVSASRHQPALPVGRLDSLGQVVRLGAGRPAVRRRRAGRAGRQPGTGPTHDVEPLPRLPALADLQLRVGQRRPAPTTCGRRSWRHHRPRAARGPDPLRRCSTSLDDVMVAGPVRRTGSRAADLVAGLPMVDIATATAASDSTASSGQALLERAPDGTDGGRGGPSWRPRSISTVSRLSSGGPAPGRSRRCRFDRALAVIRRFAALPLLRGLAGGQTGAMIALAREMAPSSGFLVETARVPVRLRPLRPTSGSTASSTCPGGPGRDGDRRAGGPGHPPVDRAGSGAMVRESAAADDLDPAPRHPGRANGPTLGRAIDRPGPIHAPLLRQGDGDHGHGACSTTSTVSSRATRSVMAAERLCELGSARAGRAGRRRPARSSQMAPGDETLVGFAMWLRGVASPELSLAVGQRP